MKRLRSVGRTLGVTIVVALALAACASGSSTTTDNTPITLTLATFNKFGYSEEMLADYHKLHPNVTVVQNIAATSQAAQDNMFTKLAAGSGLGDVEAVEVDWMPKLKQYSNLFVDLSTTETKGRWLGWKAAAATVNGSSSAPARTSARRRSATALIRSSRPALRAIPREWPSC